MSSISSDRSGHGGSSQEASRGGGGEAGRRPEGGRLRQSASFLREFIARPTTVGAIAPSSRHLAKRMLEGLDLASAGAVVEFGPGLGSFTRELLPRLGPRTRFFAIEINDHMAAAWRARYPHATLHQDSVANVQALCAQEGISEVDVIISGLPWASFDDDLQTATLEGVVRVLRPGGSLVTFGYHIGTVLPRGMRFYKRLPQYFSRVERTPYVWGNLPPAFVVRCVK